MKQVIQQGSLSLQQGTRLLHRYGIYFKLDSRTAAFLSKLFQKSPADLSRFNYFIILRHIHQGEFSPL